MDAVKGMRKIEREDKMRAFRISPRSHSKERPLQYVQEDEVLQDCDTYRLSLGLSLRVRL